MEPRLMAICNIRILGNPFPDPKKLWCHLKFRGVRSTLCFHVFNSPMFVVKYQFAESQFSGSTTRVNSHLLVGDCLRATLSKLHQEHVLVKWDGQGNEEMFIWNPES